MPYTLRVTATGVDLRFTGSVTREAVAAALAEALASAPPRGTTFLLADYGELRATEVVHTTDDLRRLAALFRDAPAGAAPPAFIAIVVPDAARYGLARQWETFAEFADVPGVTFVARTRAEAVAWLIARGVPRDELEP